METGKELVNDKVFINFKSMTNEERGSLISSYKKVRVGRKRHKNKR